MGSNGTRGPKPYTQRQAKTLFLRVPNQDWIEVVRGMKTEFRAGSGNVSALWNVEPPTPVVAYRKPRHGDHEHRLMWLEDRWQEPLGAISQESLKREGFNRLEDFRVYWCGRERKRFTPTRMVTCYRVRPWQDGDEEKGARALFQRLYGEFLPA